MSWPHRRWGQGLKLSPVREHQACIAQHFHLYRVVLVETVAYRRDDCWGKTAMVQWHFVLVLAHVAIHHARCDFHEQAGVVHEIVELLSHVDKSRRLAKGVAEERHAAKTVAWHLLIQCYQRDRFVFRVVVPVMGVGREREFAPMRGLCSTIGC